jgi:ribonuclease G
MEMTRQRQEESIRASNYQNCPYCDGRGKVKSALSMSVEIQRRIAEVMRRRKASPSNPMPIRITVNPSVLERLRTEDEDVLVDLEQRSHGHLTFVSNAHMHVEEFLITHAETNEELYAMKNK